MVSSLGRGEAVDRHHAQRADHRDDSDRQSVRPSSPRRWRHSASQSREEITEGKGERSAIVWAWCFGAGSVPHRGRGV